MPRMAKLRAAPPSPTLTATSEPPSLAAEVSSVPVWEGFCAVCKRPISIESSEAPPEALRDSAKRSRTRQLAEAASSAQVPLPAAASPPAAAGAPPVVSETVGEAPVAELTASGQRCAYVIALWGSSPEYVLGAMVLAWSLRATGTRHDLVMVHTSDVSGAALHLLQRSGWKSRLVEHVSASPALSNDGCSTMRFAKVFTKLRVLELLEYSKILMMDIDLLVRGNIDDIFDLEAPAAMVRGPEVGYKHGDRVDGRRFFAGTRPDGWSWGQASGINAGVMLLEPNQEVFLQMMAEVKDDFHPGHIRGNGPEQDYLSRFYADKWRHIGVSHNFQLHHMYFALSPACLDTADRKQYIFHPELIKVIHYSSEPKPWSRVLEEHYAEYSDETWLSEILNSFSGYRAWVLNDADCMRKEGSMNGCVMGPDGKLHPVDWEKVSMNSESKRRNGGWKSSSWSAGGDTWKATSWSAAGSYQHQNASSSVADAGDTSSSPYPGISHHKTDISGALPVKGDNEASTAPDDHEIPGCKASESVAGMVSEEGWPLGEALVVSQDAVVAAETALQQSQDEWFGAYKDLSTHLGEANLAEVVKAATTGPVIRQEWDWSTGSSDKEKPPDSSSSWTRDETGGWWVEQPLGERFVASAGLLPQKLVTLSAGGSMLLSASSQGVHAAAVASSGSACPSPISFPLGSVEEASAAATKWAEAVPHRAMVLLAVLDVSTDQAVTTATLEALASAGLGCPRQMPPKPKQTGDVSSNVREAVSNRASGPSCAVAAALGRKGDSRWYTTHAAADMAMASSVVPGDTATLVSPSGGG